MMQDSASACVCVCVVGVEDSASVCVCMSVRDVIPAAWVSETGAETLFGITSQDVLLSHRMDGGGGGVGPHGTTAAMQRIKNLSDAVMRKKKGRRFSAALRERFKTPKRSRIKQLRLVSPPNASHFSQGQELLGGPVRASREGSGHLGWRILKSTHL